jgi:hypothetical protein
MFRVTPLLDSEVLVPNRVLGCLLVWEQVWDVERLLGRTFWGRNGARETVPAPENLTLLCFLAVAVVASTP